jgi:diguanylate cyclase (GGDEF)-like protein
MPMQTSQPPRPDAVPPVGRPSGRWDTPWRLLFVLVATIFTIELLLMTGLHFLDFPPLVEIVVDSLVLVLLLMPVLLRTVVQPLRSRIDALAAAEQSLRIAHGDLERRVDERTAALTQANEALRHEIDERARMQEELHRLATTDMLTGLRNRRAFKDLLGLEVKRSERHGDALSIIMFDIDRFKRINDTHGHHVGDEVLVQVARLVRERIRESEIFARWGGEEFIILLPHTVLQSAVHLGWALHERLLAHPFPQVGTVTASFGVAQYAAGDSLDGLLQRADAAVYRAKANGRSRVEAEAVTPAA